MSGEHEEKQHGRGDTVRVAITSNSFSNNEALIGELESLGVSVHPKPTSDRLDEEAVIDFFREAEADMAIVGLEPITEHVLEECPDLKYVSKYGVGLDNIDVDALEAAGVGLGWSGGVNRRSVAELTLAFALGHMRNVFPSVAAMRRGVWKKDGGRQLSDATLGIVGLGNIGTDVAGLVRQFGTRVLYRDIVDKSATATELGLHERSYEALLEESDIISFHVPSTPLTRGMFGAREVELTGGGALIINTARGDIVDFEAVARALEEGRLGGYAADVFPEEPFDASEYASVPNLYCTPHIGGNAKEAVLAMGRAAIEHIRTELEKSEGEE